MVLVIVTRNIDLSVGSLLGFVAMIMGVIQAQVLPQFLGLGHPMNLDHRARSSQHRRRHGHRRHQRASSSPISAMPALHRDPGRLSGLARRYRSGREFSGKTIAPMDTHVPADGRAAGRLASDRRDLELGAAAVVCVGDRRWRSILGRRQRRRFNFPLRPMWAETTLAVVGCAIALAAVLGRKLVSLAAAASLA